MLRTRWPWIPVWAIMALASFIVVVSGIVPIDQVGTVIDLNVVLFLVGMFSLVSLAESSGLLGYFTSLMLFRVRDVGALIYVSAFVFGILSAIAVNDTIALMGPPIAYSIAKTAGINPGAMYLLLAFSITIGSVMTPIGNPQNVLVAIQSGINAPFVKFVEYLAIPTLLNLFITAYIIKKIYGIGSPRLDLSAIPREEILSNRDAALSLVGIIAAITWLVINDLMELMKLPHIRERGFIPFIVAAGIYIFSSNPRKTLSSIDWGTIVFFITMFITMEGIWRSGILQPLLTLFLPGKVGGIEEISLISAISLLLSQLLSNVPFTRLFIQYMHQLGYGGNDVEAWITLAMASTIAGNLTILGAASNIIILESLETRFGASISFTRFLKIGSIVTAINLGIYIPYIYLYDIAMASFTR
ncbi:MAG: SLC13 family permease [Desulfurococcales archaeon]|nr:SLC13 family permease [Desulfurococcales archaeon]